MNAIEKENKIKLLNDDISIYRNIVSERPNDELSFDVLNFKLKQLDELLSTPTDEDLKDDYAFSNILKNQNNIVNSIKNNENKSIKNLRILFNSKLSRFEIKYQYENEIKKKYYTFNDSFLKTANVVINENSKKYGKYILKEYDSILFNLLNELDIDLNTKFCMEYLNNNYNIYKVLYDFSDLMILKRKLRNEIKKSYKINKNSENVFMIKDSTGDNFNFLQSFMEIKVEDEIVKPIDIKKFYDEHNIENNNINLVNGNDIKTNNQMNSNLIDEDIEVLDEVTTSQSLKDILNFDNTEILDESFKIRN